MGLRVKQNRKEIEVRHLKHGLFKSIIGENVYQSVSFFTTHILVSGTE